jgi:hypothetical protein
VVLFFLPWVGLQCKYPKDVDLKNPNAKLDEKNLAWKTIVSQSGFQAATGEYTIVDEDLRQVEEQAKKMKGQAGVKAGQKEEKPDSALLLWGFLIAAVAGIFIGFLVPSSPAKQGMLTVCCLIALGTVGAQAAIGFPIGKEKNDMKGMGGNNNMGVKQEDFVRTTYKVPFYLTLVLCVGAAVTTLLETSPKPKKKKKRYVEEEEEEELPEEDS